MTKNMEEKVFHLGLDVIDHSKVLNRLLKPSPSFEESVAEVIYIYVT